MKKSSLFILTSLSLIMVNSIAFSMNNEKNNEDINIRHSPKPSQTNINISNRKSTAYQSLKFLGYDKLREMPYRGEMLPKGPSSQKLVDNKSIYVEKIHSIVSPLKLEGIEQRKNREEKLLKASELENFALRNLEFATERQKYLRSDKDERKEIKEHNYYPNYYHGHLNIIYGDTTEYLGSGTLIDKRIVLTAAHNLYDRLSKQEAKSIEFHAGKRMTEAVASGYGIKLIYPEEWTKESNNQLDPYDYDLGVIVLSKDFEVEYDKLQLTHIGLQALKDSELTEKKTNKEESFYIRGYPGAVYDKNQEIQIVNGEIMYGHKGSLSDFTSTQVFYNIDTSAGQSGSSVWFGNERDGYFCCAVHSRSGKEGQNYNIGTRINKEKFNLILKWIEYANNLKENENSNEKS